MFWGIAWDFATAASSPSRPENLSPPRRGLAHASPTHWGGCACVLEGSPTVAARGARAAKVAPFFIIPTAHDCEAGAARSAVRAAAPPGARRGRRGDGAAPNPLHTPSLYHFPRTTPDTHGWCGPAAVVVCLPSGMALREQAR